MSIGRLDAVCQMLKVICQMLNAILGKSFDRC